MNRLKQTRIKVLIASHLGKPWGGISIQNELLLKSELNELVDLQAIGTSAGNTDINIRGKWSISNILESIKNILVYIRTINTFQPDIVDVGTAYGTSFLKHGIMVLYAHYKHCKVIITFHCSINKIITDSSIINKYTKIILNNCDGLSAISQEWLQIINEYPKLKVRYIPNAIDVHQYSNICHIRKPIVDILFLGHIEYQKGIYDLIEAASNLIAQNIENFKLNLVGENLETDKNNNLQDFIKYKNLNLFVKFYKSLYGSSKLDIFRQADIMVLPSYHEGMPLSIIEGMAAGLPIVATNVGGIPDLLINNLTGIIISPHNIEELTRALSTLIDDDDLRIRMGTAGRERAIKYFDINMKANNLYNFYADIINS